MSLGPKSARISIVGVGQVGGAAAYALILSSLAYELLLVDNNHALREGQVRDLADAAYTTNSSTRVRAANYHEAGQCDIIIITAGSRRTVGQSGLDVASRNTSIVRTVVDAMAPVRSDAILIVVSHPVDLLTMLAQELSRLPPAQVFGVGTFLDSSRLRGLLSDRVGIAANSMDIYVVGVHGELTQVTAWSAASVGGVHVDKSLSAAEFLTTRAEVEQESQQRAQTIVRAKGSMPFGMGSVVASICASIVLDKRNVRAVSHYQPEFGCYFSLPAVLGRGGIVQTVGVPLSAEEAARVADEAARVKAQMDALRKNL